MQREEDGGIVISCDFCGTDWDEVVPMIEGHRGSVICLSCVEKAWAAVSSASGDGPGDASGGAERLRAPCACASNCPRHWPDGPAPIGLP